MDAEPEPSRAPGQEASDGETLKSLVYWRSTLRMLIRDGIAYRESTGEHGAGQANIYRKMASELHIEV